VNDAFTLDEDCALTLSSAELLATDSDIEGDTLSLVSVQDATHGMVAIVNGQVVFTPAANYSGAASFTYTISDGQGGTSTAIVNLTIDPTNDTPVAVNDAFTLAEDLALTLSPAQLVANDTDLDGDLLSLVSVQDATHGTVAIVNGQVVFVPAADYNGAASFTYTIQDASGATSTAVVNLTIGVENDVPVAVNDRFSLAEDLALSLNPAQLLANDTDADQNTLAIVSVQGATHGTVALVNGQVVFTPAANYNGPASFTYTISDGQGGTSTALVHLKINPVNDTPVAVEDSFVLAEDMALRLHANDLLANDADVDNDHLAILSVQGATHGTVSLVDNQIVFVPAENYHGPASFTYTVSDGQGGTSIATVSLTVNPENDTPVAVNDVFTLNEDSALTIDVKANDTDLDQDSLTVQSVTQAAHGTVVVNTDGTVTYTPAADYNGVDSFSYVVRDPSGATSTAVVSLTVNAQNDAPVAVNDVRTLDEDASLQINVLANDSDIDGNALSVQSVSQPAHGTAVVNNDGTVTYTPVADYNGADSFSYVVRDGSGATSMASVQLIVNPLNDAPVAVSDAFTLAEDLALSIDPSQLLADDTDADGNVLSVLSVQGAQHGTVAIVDGMVVFTPAANYSGPASFTYTISDGQGGTSTAAVNLTVNPVNDAPVAVSDVFSLAEDLALSLSPAQLVANDTDADGNALGILSVQNAEHGTVAIINGAVVFTPAANYNGPASFSYTVSDGQGGTSTAAVNLTVSATNDVPVAVNDIFGLAEDSALVLNSAQLLANDTDADGNALSILSVTNATHGTVALVNGTVVFTPAANYAGPASFSYVVSDDHGGTSTASVSLNVTGVADSPVVVVNNAAGAEDAGAIALNVSASLADVDSETLSLVTISGVPTGASLSAGINLGGGVWSIPPASLSSLAITPPANYSGTMNLTLNATSTEGTSTATTSQGFAVTVSPIGDVSVTVANVSGTGDGAINLGLSASSIAIADSDGSETVSQIKLTFSDLPQGAVVNGATWSSAANGYLVASAAALSNVTVLPPDGWDGQFGVTLAVTTNEGSTAQSFTVSTESGETIVGTSGNDLLLGTDGSDHITANAGNDVILSGGGNDTIIGGTGNDIVYASSGNNAVDVGDGNDDVLTGSGNDTISGGAGNDMLAAGGGNDTVDGGTGNDKIWGGDGNDTISGGDGNDEISGGAGNDYLSGDVGNDEIYGGSGNNIIIGGEGNDKLYAGDGADQFVFDLGDGHDTIFDFGSGDQLTFNGINPDAVQIAASGNDVVITIIGQDGSHANQVTLQDAAAGMSSSEKEHIADSYSITDTGQGVNITVDQTA
jgi:large repetitive protein